MKVKLVSENLKNFLKEETLENNEYELQLFSLEDSDEFIDVCLKEFPHADILTYSSKKEVLYDLFKNVDYLFTLINKLNSEEKYVGRLRDNMVVDVWDHHDVKINENEIYKIQDIIDNLI